MKIMLALAFCLLVFQTNDPILADSKSLTPDSNVNNASDFKSQTFKGASIEHGCFESFSFMLGKWVCKTGLKIISEFWTEEPDKSRLYCIRTTVIAPGEPPTYDFLMFRQTTRNDRVDCCHLNAGLETHSGLDVGTLGASPPNKVSLTLTNPMHPKEYSAAAIFKYERLSENQVRCTKYSNLRKATDTFLFSKIESHKIETAQ